MIKVGLIGLGKMGLSHQAILNAHPEVNLTAVCDASQYVLSVLSKYTGVKTHTNYRTMIDIESLDAVVIATPSRLHGEMVRYALERDVHVFCEKPFCLDVNEGQELVELAESRNLANQVGYHYRHVEAFREAKRLVKAGILGKIHHVRAEAYGPVALRPSGSTWRSSSTEGGGCLYDYACHAVDLVSFIVGAPQAVGGVTLNKIFSRDVDDEVYASLYFSDGFTGQLAVNWSDESHRKMSTKLMLWGTNGRISVDRQECQIYLRSQVDSPALIPAGWTIRYTTDLIEPVWYYLRGEEYSRQIDHFTQCVQGVVQENESSFASSLKTDNVIYTIMAAANEGRVAVGRHSVGLARTPAKKGFFGFLRILFGNLKRRTTE